jgi:hypothetical protein
MFSLFRPPSPADPGQAFWQWFQREQATLFAPGEDPGAAFCAISRELARVHRGLSFELGPVSEGVRELVISAGGVQDVIPIARALVEAAPAVPGWRIVGLRPRRPGGGEVILGGVRLCCADVRFRAEPDGDRIGVVLHIAGYSPTRDHVHEQAAFLLLDRLLGEEEVASRLGFIEFEPLLDPPEPGLRPIEELASVVGAPAAA